MSKFGFVGFGTENVHSRQEVETRTAQEVNPVADEAYIKASIFISQLEIFQEPS